MHVKNSFLEKFRFSLPMRTFFGKYSKEIFPTNLWFHINITF